MYNILYEKVIYFNCVLEYKVDVAIVIIFLLCTTCDVTVILHRT